MPEREAACSCGALRVVADGDPVRVSVCHCLACQRRTGSVFGVSARYDRHRVQVAGEYRDYVRISDDGGERVFHFCPTCGATVFYELPAAPDIVAVPVGGFADPEFPAPIRSIYESRRHAWVGLPADLERDTD